MGFTAVWISPVVSNIGGSTAIGEAYHGCALSLSSWRDSMRRRTDGADDVLSHPLGSRAQILDARPVEAQHQLWRRRRPDGPRRRPPRARHVPDGRHCASCRPRARHVSVPADADPAVSRLPRSSTTSPRPRPRRLRRRRPTARSTSSPTSTRSAGSTPRTPTRSVCSHRPGLSPMRVDADVAFVLLSSRRPTLSSVRSIRGPRGIRPLTSCARSVHCRLARRHQRRAARRESGSARTTCTPCSR